MDKNFCEHCGRLIEVQVFKGTGSCSADCSKALGRRTDAKDLVLLTADEHKMIRQKRGKRGSKR